MHYYGTVFITEYNQFVMYLLKQILSFKPENTFFFQNNLEFWNVVYSIIIFI